MHGKNILMNIGNIYKEEKKQEFNPLFSYFLL
jgi:hypothetical protein